MRRLAPLIAFLGKNWLAIAAAVAADAPLPEYAVRRTSEAIEIDGELREVAWFAAPPIGRFHFPWFENGIREASLVKLLWDDDCLYVASVCEDRHITARHRERDSAIPSDDCLEIMLAPDAARPAFYFNIEWNVIGGYVDGHRPNGAEGPRVEWDARNVRLSGSYVGTLNNDADQDTMWCVEVAIPWVNFRDHLAHFPPRAGDEFRANFNRHGGDTNSQYSQWSPGDTPAPAFHVPHRFGRLILSEDSVPFSSSP